MNTKKTGHFFSREVKQSELKIAALCALLLIALLVRIVFVFGSPVRVRNGFGQFGDSFFYHISAYNLYKGNGFSAIDDGRAFGFSPQAEKLNYGPAITRGPVYPFFISLVYRFFSNPKDMLAITTWHLNWDRVRLAQCIVDTITCLLVFLIVRLIYPTSWWPAFISAALYALSFYNIFYTRTLLSESINTFLVTLSLLCTVAAFKTQKRWLWLLSGVSFGLTVLSRLEHVLFLIVVCAYLLFLNRRTVLKKVIFLLLGVAIIIAPWTFRNYAVFKKFVLVSTGSLGYSLYLGTFEGNDAPVGWGNFPDTLFRSKQERRQVEGYYQLYDSNLRLGSMAVKEADDFFLNLALRRIRENPFQCFKSWVTKAPRLWYQNYIPMYGEKEAPGVFFIFYFLCAAYSFRASTKEERILTGFIWLLFIYLNLIFLPLHIEPRYSVYVMPGIICLSGIGVWKVFILFRGRFKASHAASIDATR